MNTNKNQIKTVKLGEVAEFVNGYPFKPTDWHPDEQGLPIIRIQNLNNETKPFNYFLGKVPGKYYVDDGALLFSWSGTPGTSFGAFFWNRGPAVVNQHIFRVIWGDKVDPNYFRYAMNSTLDHIISQAHGGVGLKHITKGKLLDVEIPLPPLPEQKRIAEILDLADEARRKRRENLTLYDDLIRSLFLQTFGDPVSNPMAWEVKKLKDMSTKILSGNTPLGGRKVYVDEGVTFFRSQNVWKNRLVMDDIAYIDGKTHSGMSKSSLKNKDILMTKTGRINTENSSLGRAAMFTGEDDSANVNGHVYLIRLKVEHNTRTDRHYPLAWEQIPVCEMKGLLVHFSGSITVRDNNPFGFVSARGVDIFISPPQVDEEGFEDGSAVQGWALKGLKPHSTIPSWKALIIEHE